MTPLETTVSVFFAILYAIVLPVFLVTGSGVAMAGALLFLAGALWWCIVPPID